MAGKQGFASMTPERRREIAALGGKAAQAKGVCHRWNTETASTAGRKGGVAAQIKRKGHSNLETNALPDVPQEGI